MKRRFVISAALALAVCAAAPGQAAGPQAGAGQAGTAAAGSVPGGAPGAAVTAAGAPPSGAQALALALSAPDYPVTPGDQYLLSYWQAGVDVASPISVQGDFSVDLGLFGLLSARGMTYLQLRQAVRKAVISQYPRALPSFALTSTGAFRVLVTGEIADSRYLPAWGLSRLSDLVLEAGGSPSSYRAVEVVSEKGTRERYDLLKAVRLGRTDQDPLVRPGEQIVLARGGVSVQVIGEVRFPGTYQVLPGEDLRLVVDTYAGGPTPEADLARATLDRIAPRSLQTQGIDLAPGAPDPEAQDGDVLRIPSRADSLALLYFEGAVIAPVVPGAAGAAAGTPPAGAASAAAAVQAGPYGRITRPYRDGETLSEALMEIRSSLAPQADLRDASILHANGSPRTWVNLEEVLSGDGSAPAVALEPFDRIVIPVSRFFVFVSGAVSAAGSYPYAPDQSYRYYLGLAGAASAAGSADSVTITDAQGANRALSDTVQPEDSIFVAPTVITVWGAVVAPGNYPYRAGRTAAYYVGLAGGVDAGRSNGAYEVIDSMGKRRASRDPLVPGDRIHVQENSFLYNFNQYFPVFASTATLVAAIATIAQVVRAYLPAH